MLRPPTRLVKRNPKTMIFFLTLNVLAYLVMIAFAFPCK